jgi:hypothetical protein
VRATLLCLLGLATAAATRGEEPAAVNAAQLLHPSLKACAAIQRDTERLICYDRAVAQLAEGKDTNAPPPSAEELFGVGRVARADRPGADVKREELAKIVARVKKLRDATDGSLIVELDNGQVWQQVSSDVSLVVDVGDTVTISRGVLGSYRLSTSGNRVARVRRVR